MSISLKDQLLGLGYKPAPKPEPAPRSNDVRRQDSGRQPEPRRPAGGKPDTRRTDPRRPDQRPPQNRKPDGGVRKPHTPRTPRTQEEIDLGKAYALRAQREKDERIEAERVKQEEARLRREAKAKLAELLKDKSLNDPSAEIARHFSYGGKIKRVYVNPDQLKALNAGELGVLQDGGRYLLVPLALLLEAEAIFAPCVALKVDPNALAGEDPYSDPAYRVPDDLVW